MRLHVFSVYDSIAEKFNKIFCDINQASAIRAFKNAGIEEINKKDFFLYHVGEFNDSDGTLKKYDVPRRISDNFTDENDTYPESLESNQK